MKKIVFACVHNAGRSQIAAALFSLYADPQKAYATSAGTRPSGEVHPEVLEVLREIGVATDGLQPKLATFELLQDADLLVTMGCGEACPVVPGLRRVDWPLRDPKGESFEVVRAVREEIRELVQELVAAEKVARPA